MKRRSKGLIIPVYQYRPECITRTWFRCYVIPETQFYFRFEGDTSSRMRQFQNFLKLQRTLRLNKIVTRKNQYVTVCCKQIISPIPNESCYFKRSLAIIHGNACSKFLQVNDAWLSSSRTKKKKSQKQVEAEKVSFLGIFMHQSFVTTPMGPCTKAPENSQIAGTLSFHQATMLLVLHVNEVMSS